MSLFFKKVFFLEKRCVYSSNFFFLELNVILKILFLELTFFLKNFCFPEGKKILFFWKLPWQVEKRFYFLK